MSTNFYLLLLLVGNSYFETHILKYLGIESTLPPALSHEWCFTLNTKGAISWTLRGYTVVFSETCLCLCVVTGPDSSSGHQLLGHGAVLRSLSCDQKGYMTLRLIAAGLPGERACVCVCVFLCVCERERESAGILAEIAMEIGSKQMKIPKLLRYTNSSEGWNWTLQTCTCRMLGSGVELRANLTSGQVG